LCGRYLHAPEDSAQKFDSEGFFRTGDFAIRQNGRIIFKGRANMDLLKVDA
jgi:malonyl-CoA/methylmalonyl-CoA synthetase